jgi:hypothetical protein
MSYSTGTATGANDLLDKLRLFCIAEGWTVNRNASITGGKELCLNKGSSYFNLKSGENITLLINGSNQTNKYGININGSDGYDAGSNWDRQPGYSRRNITASSTDQYVSFLPMVTNFGPFPAYHLFSLNGGDCIYLELEITAGVYQRLGFGKLELFNASTVGDGRFFYSTGSGHVTNSTGTTAWLGSDSTSSNSLEEVPFRYSAYSLNSPSNSGSAVRVALDTFDNWAGSGPVASSTYLGQIVTGLKEKILLYCSPNPLNGVGVLIPITVNISRADLYYHPLGTVPGIRYLDMTNYLPGDEFTLGGDTWKVFPWYNKGGRSYEHGIAYLKEL